MKEKKIVTLVMVLILMIFIISCSNIKKSENSKGKGDNNGILTMDLSKKDYLTYLNNKYDEYLNDLDVDTKYDVNKADIKADDYIDNLREAYRELGNKLLTFKNDLESGVRSSDEEVKGLNDDIINSIDEIITNVEKVNIELEDKEDELTSKSKEEMKKELIKIEADTKKNRENLAKLVNDAESKLNT